MAKATPVCAIVALGFLLLSPQTHAAVESVSLDDLLKLLKIERLPQPPLMQIKLADIETTGEDGTFDDGWYSSRAFRGPFRAEFYKALEGYLRARGFNVTTGPADFLVRVSLDHFNGRKRFHDDGGDLFGSVSLDYKGKTIGTKAITESLSYHNEKEERPRFQNDYGLKVRFDTILFFRLSASFYSRISSFLDDTMSAPIPIEEVDRPPVGSVLPVSNSEVGVYGFLTIESEPESAEIFLDGTLIATTPAPEIRIKDGSHTLRISKKGYQDWTRSVKVLAGNKLSLRAELERGAH